MPICHGCLRPNYICMCAWLWPWNARTGENENITRYVALHHWQELEQFLPTTIHNICRVVLVVAGWRITALRPHTKKATVLYCEK